MNRRNFLRSLFGASTFVAAATVLGGVTASKKLLAESSPAKVTNLVVTSGGAGYTNKPAVTLNGMDINRDYYSIEWPVVTREWQFGTYTNETLVVYRWPPPLMPVRPKNHQPRAWPYSLGE